MTFIDFSRVFEVLPSAHMLLDRDYRFVAVNAAYEAAVLRSREELLGQALFDLFPNDGEGGLRLRESFERVFETGEQDTLAYIPYDIPRPASQGGGMAVRYWTAVHSAICDDDGNVLYLLQNTVDVTEMARMREAVSLPFRLRPMESSLLERAKEAEHANQQLLAESEDFRRLFQEAPAFFAVLSGPEHVFTFASNSYVRLIGGRSVIGLPIREALPEVIDQGFVDLLDRVFGEGYVHQAEGARVMLQNAPGMPPAETFLDFSYNPIHAPDGSITGVFVQGMDRTESFRQQQRLRLMVDELNHRVKNALATVQSIAGLTLRSTGDTNEARRAFEARIVALARAHDMLSERRWDDTEIGSIVHQELSAYDSAHVRVGGPDLVVNAKATVAMALLIHELATNAAKHGALSVPDGRLGVSWHEDQDNNLVFEWTERGGPAVAPPTRRGFGSRMLQTVVTGELGGTLETRYPPEGFSATLIIPASSYEKAPHAPAQ